MGLKDWFGGGKKKEEYHRKLKEAMADGKLDAQKAAELEALRASLDVDDIADDKTQARREVYNEAAGAVKASGKLTAKEAAELARVQKFLGLRDDQIDNTKRDLGRLKLLTEIREGRLPVIAAGSPSIRGLALADEEVPHFAFAAELFDQMGGAGVGGEAGYLIAMPFNPGLLVEDLQVDNATPIGEGQVIVTSRRLIFRGARNTYAFKYSDAESGMFLYRDGIRLPKKLGNTLIRAKTRESLKVAAELIARLASAV